MKKLFVILLIFVLPVSGAAAQENEVVALPAVAPLAQVDVTAAVNYSSDSLAEYYTPSETESAVDGQMPQMTAKESERAEALLKDYQAGARPAENVLNKLENVAVGVYTLNPGDYEGEALYTLLPFDPLTDEQILEVIDAFAQCGRVFDPAGLSYRNCMRGGGIEASRFYRDDERSRRGVLRDLYIRQGLTARTAYTPLVSDDGLGLVTLSAGMFSGLDRFLFIPYRQLTDDELLAYTIYSEDGDTSEYGNYEAYETQLRTELTRVIGAPLMLTREYESMGRMGDYNVSYGDERVYTVTFRAVDGAYFWGALDVDTGKVLIANAWKESNLGYSDLHLDPFDEKWLGIAKEAVRAVRGDDVAIASAESLGECYVSELGYGVQVVVVMEDGGHYTILIAYQNESVFDELAYESHAPNLERMYPDEMFR